MYGDGMLTVLFRLIGRVYFMWEVPRSAAVMTPFSMEKPDTPQHTLFLSCEKVQLLLFFIYISTYPGWYNQCRPPLPSSLTSRCSRESGFYSFHVWVSPWKSWTCWVQKRGLVSLTSWGIRVAGTALLHGIQRSNQMKMPLILKRISPFQNSRRIFILQSARREGGRTCRVEMGLFDMVSGGEVPSRFTQTNTQPIVCLQPSATTKHLRCGMCGCLVSVYFLDSLLLYTL